MSNIYFNADALASIKEKGIAATFIETRTSSERGSNYTSASVEVLAKGENWPTLLLVVERVNGCDHYARQLAAEAIEKVNIGFNDRFTFRAHKFIKKADHVSKLMYTAMPTLEEILQEGKQ